MKLTKSKLKQMIKEELAQLGEDDGPQVEWKISYEDGRVFARGMDPDTWETDDPMEIELDPAKLLAAIDSGELEKEKERGPEAGSMPYSQSPHADPKRIARRMKDPRFRDEYYDGDELKPQFRKFAG